MFAKIKRLFAGSNTPPTVPSPAPAPDPCDHDDLFEYTEGVRSCKVCHQVQRFEKLPVGHPSGNRFEWRPLTANEALSILKDLRSRLANPTIDCADDT